MPALAGSVSVEVKAELEKFRRGLRGAEQETRKFDRAARGAAGTTARSFVRLGDTAKRTQGSLTGLRTALAAFGGIAFGGGLLRQFVNFDESLTRIEVLVGINRDQVDAWRADLINMAPAVAKGPGELADALFFITSAGLRGSAAIDALRSSAQAAAIGLGETKVVADAATSAVNAYGAANLSSQRAVALLAAAVREGKLEASTIAPVLGNLLSTTAELGVGFDQVVAGIAAMSRTGTDAASAATSLQAIMVTLASGGTKQSQEALAAVSEASTGTAITFSDLRRSVREEGLLETLFQLRDIIGDNEEAMSSIFPNVRALRGLLNLLGANADAARQIFASVISTVGSDLPEAFDQASQSASFKYRRSMVQLNAEMQRFAELTVPSAIKALRTITDNMQKTVVITGVLIGAWLGLRKGFVGALSGALIGGGAAGGLTKFLTDLRNEAEAATTAISALKNEINDDKGLAPVGTPIGPVAARSPSRILTAEQKEMLATEKQRLEVGRLLLASLQAELDGNIELSRELRLQAQIRGQISDELRELAPIMASSSEDQIRREEELNRALEKRQERLQFFGGTLVDVLDRATERGASLTDILEDVVRMIKKAALEALILGTGPLGGGGGGLLGSVFSGGGGGTAGVGAFTTTLTPAALGNVLDRGRLVPMRRGGIIDRPIIFPMANGAGLAGESGPEGVLPLRRGSDGRLGVEASGMGSGQPQVQINLIGLDKAPSEQRTRRNGNRVGVDLIFSAVNQGFAGGEFDEVMSGRFGAQPVTSRR